MVSIPDGSEIIVRDGSVVWRQFETETIVLALDSSNYLSLNATGTLLWPLIVEGKGRDALVHCLVSEFSIDPQQAEKDVTNFIRTCEQQRLVDIK